MSSKIKIILSFSILALLAISIVILSIYFINSQLDNKVEKNIVTVNKKESCLECHSDVIGLEDSHSPEKIGCFSCHLGNPNSTLKEEAHKNIILIPGNINDIEMTCSSSNCHPQMLPRIKKSIMNTMNGVVSVDKWVFGEANTPTFKQSIHEIKFSLAEKHLRNLCASCHLSNLKTELGPINELSRGGGCLACHLNYNKDALKELNTTNKKITKFHPSLNLNITNNHCFGCHSRSGRISLSYDGWHETLYLPDEVKSQIGFRFLDDGRVVKQIQKDIHSEYGLLCIDCHNSYEIMGDGNYYLHKEEQLQIKCIDCHLVTKPNTKRIKEFDYESKKILELKKEIDTSRNYIITEKGIPYTNVFYEKGKTVLIKKETKEKIEIKKPSFKCTEGKAHKNLSCQTCHNSWTPQCIGCHTEYDENSTMYDLLDNKEAEGEWKEHPKDLLAEQTTLGVRIKDGKKEIIEVMPGMILTIKKSKNEKEKFNRLFAPAFSHTIRKEAKSCESCHLNPVMYGYGRGKLEYKIQNNIGKWTFSPMYSLTKFDNMPQDAWIEFLKERKLNSATRENIRPFSVDEQKKILTLGSCLKCHKSNSKVINATLFDFEKVIKLRTKKCILPKWN